MDSPAGYYGINITFGEKSMKYRIFGKTGEKVSVLGYGDMGRQ